MKAAIVIALVIACVAFLLALPVRNEIESLTLKVPERRPGGYNAAALDAFKNSTANAPLADGRTALDAYRTPVLVPLDLIFAISLGAFVALLGIALARHYPAWRLAFLASAVLGLVYAVADVGENIMLTRLLGAHTASGGEARLASLLTQTKIVSLIASGSGILVFVALQTFGRMVRPAGKARSGKQEGTR